MLNLSDIKLVTIPNPDTEIDSRTDTEYLAKISERLPNINPNIRLGSGYPALGNHGTYNRW